MHDPQATITDPSPRRSASDEGRPTELAARLRLSATRLARLLRQSTDTGLTPTQLSALAAVERNAPLTLGALAEHERVAPPTVTKVVAKLEADGYVERTVDPADRRVAHLTVTDEGLSLLGAIRARKDAWLTSRIALLDDDQRDRLFAALDVLDELVCLPAPCPPRPTAASADRPPGRSQAPSPQDQP